LQVIATLPEAGKESDIKWIALDEDRPSVSNIDWRIIPMDVPDDRKHPDFGVFRMFAFAGFV
jgi:hypothetical protein